MHRNSEHYPNPTFSGAYFQIRRDEQIIKSGERFIPWVYIASPYRGNIEKNTDNARRYSLFAVQCGKLPFCPHIYFTQFLNDNIKTERRQGLTLALHMLKRCTEMWVFGDYISSGMQREIRAARKWNIPIKYFDENCGVMKL